MGTIDFEPLWITLKTGIVASVFSFFIGIAFAELVINTKGRVRAFWDGLLTLPMVLPPTVAGYILLRIFSTRRPFGSFLSNSMGIQVVHTWLGCVVAATIIALPLMYRNARAAFEQIDENVIYAARTLGISEWKVFWKIRLPMAKPGINAPNSINVPMVLLQIINEIPEIAAPFFTAFKHEHNSPRKIPTGCKNLPHGEVSGSGAAVQDLSGIRGVADHADVAVGDKAAVVGQRTYVRSGGKQRNDGRGAPVGRGGICRRNRQHEFVCGIAGEIVIVSGRIGQCIVPGSVPDEVSRKEGGGRDRSGEVRRIGIECRATIGTVSNDDHNLRELGKAGAKRWRGIRPTVRGVAMNPVDHPHGGGEGKTGTGRAPVTPWGQLTRGYRTRNNKRTDNMIVQRRYRK